MGLSCQAGRQVKKCFFTYFSSDYIGRTGKSYTVLKNGSYVK